MKLFNIIEKITDHDVTTILHTMTYRLPDYFYVIAANHADEARPVHECGTSGLKYHSLIVAYFAYRLALAWGFDQTETSCMIAAGMLHDGFKNGYDNKASITDPAHHSLAASWLRIEFPDNAKAELIASTIEGASSNTDEAVPVNKYQLLLSAANVLAATPELRMSDDYWSL